MYRRTGRKRKRKYFRRGYNRTAGFYGRNRKRRRYNGGGRGGFEKKFFDLNMNDPVVGAVGGFAITSNTAGGAGTSTSSIVNIPQGTGESQRIGRKCTITKIQARINFQFLASETADLTRAGNAHETIRFVLFWDKQCNGTGIAATDLFQTDQYLEYRELSNVKRFTVLLDRILTWNAGAIAAGNGTANDSAIVIKDYQIRFSKNIFIPIEYSTTDGDLTSIKSNNIGIMMWAKHGGRMTMEASKIRLRFIDF